MMKELLAFALPILILIIVFSIALVIAWIYGLWWSGKNERPVLFTVLFIIGAGLPSLQMPALWFIITVAAMYITARALYKQAQKDQKGWFGLTIVFNAFAAALWMLNERYRWFK